jgi:Uma2 family endonuclease
MPETRMTASIELRLPQEWSDEQLFEFCHLNGDLRIERTARGEIVVMPASGGQTGRVNALLNMRLGNWALNDATGCFFDSSTGFLLPDGAMRCPDAAWVSSPRWDSLTEEQKPKFVPLCPEFVAELRSPSDRLPALQSARNSDGSSTRERQVMSTVRARPARP